MGHSIASELSLKEKSRYSRQLVLPDFGEAGQIVLKSSSILVIGVGGLGCPAALYLTAAGIGRLGLIDNDRVELRNLQRQVLYTMNDLDKPKTEIAFKRLNALNPEVRMDCYPFRFEESNALDLFRSYDIIIDGSDNFETRYLVNDAAHFTEKPFVFGSVQGLKGQTALFLSGPGPCYRCLYPTPPPPELSPNCAELGVLGVIPGLIGTIQATYAIQYLLNRTETLADKLLIWDAQTLSSKSIQLQKDPNCPLCGSAPRITELHSENIICKQDEISVNELKERLKLDPSVVLLDVRESFEFELGHAPNARHAPLSEILAHCQSLQKNSAYIVYCSSGTRGNEASRILRSEGYRNVTNLAGGFDAWKLDNPELLS